MYRCCLHFVDCKWELTTCASKHSLVYAIDEIQISEKRWGCARDKGSKAEPEFNVLISIWGLCWCNVLFVFLFDSLRFMYLNILFEDACSGLPEIVQYASFVQLYLSRSLTLATAIPVARACRLKKIGLAWFAFQV